jgi:hypothetical protein
MVQRNLLFKIASSKLILYAEVKLTHVSAAGILLENGGRHCLEPVNAYRYLPAQMRGIVLCVYFKSTHYTVLDLLLRRLKAKQAWNVTCAGMAFLYGETCTTQIFRSSQGSRKACVVKGLVAGFFAQDPFDYYIAGSLLYRNPG